MKLWIDECLSPTLVERANRRGYWATCNRDRDLLGADDSVLHEIVIGEEASLRHQQRIGFRRPCDRPHPCTA